MKVQFQHIYHASWVKNPHVSSRRRVRHALQEMFEKALVLGQVSLYRGQKPGNHTRIKACTVCVLRDDGSDQVIRIGCAFCGPHERFSRAEGHRRSEERTMGILSSAPPATDTVAPTGPTRFAAVG